MTGFKSNKWEESKYWMTICTPTYQRAKALNRVYDSLLNLKNPYDKGKTIQFEWLIVDDGSKDGTKDIVKNGVMRIRFLSVIITKKIKENMLL